MKVIGIVGTRRKNNHQTHLPLVEAEFLKLYQLGDKICSGLCPKGADQFAVIIASKWKVEGIWFPANWEEYGKEAGLLRNTDIARTSDFLIALVSDDRTGGVEDTVKKFIRFHGEEGLIILS